MGRFEKLLDRLLRGTSDQNIAFNDLRALLKRLAFTERIRGDHHIFTREGTEEIINLQPRGSKAKPYQVKQVRNVLLKHGLVGDADGGENDAGGQATDQTDQSDEEPNSEDSAV